MLWCHLRVYAAHARGHVNCHLRGRRTVQAHAREVPLVDATHRKLHGADNPWQPKEESDENQHHEDDGNAPSSDLRRCVDQGVGVGVCAREGSSSCLHLREKWTWRLLGESLCRGQVRDSLSTGDFTRTMPFFLLLCFV